MTVPLPQATAGTDQVNRAGAPQAISHPPNTPKDRRKWELELLEPFIKTVMASGRYIHEQARNHQPKRQPSQPSSSSSAATAGATAATANASRSRFSVLTDAEKAVFQKQIYYGWSTGLLAGATTFVVVLGGLHWRSSLSSSSQTLSWFSRLRGRGATARLPSPSSDGRLTKSALLGPGGAGKLNSKMTTAVQAAATATTNVAETNVQRDLQRFMSCGVLAAIVAYTTASSNFDDLLSKFGSHAVATGCIAFVSAHVSSIDSTGMRNIRTTATTATTGFLSSCRRGSMARSRYQGIGGCCSIGP